MDKIQIEKWEDAENENIAAEQESNGTPEALAIISAAALIAEQLWEIDRTLKSIESSIPIL